MLNIDYIEHYCDIVGYWSSHIRHFLHDTTADDQNHDDLDDNYDFNDHHVIAKNFDHCCHHHGYRLYCAYDFASCGSLICAGHENLLSDGSFRANSASASNALAIDSRLLFRLQVLPKCQ